MRLSMPLPGPGGHQEAQASTPHASQSFLPENTPLEFRALLSACRVFLGTEKLAKLEALLKQGPEWERLLALSNRHGVMPLLYRSISQNCPQAMPAEWLAQLRMQYMMNAARNMKMTAELLRILESLEKAGIKAVPLKGPVLAQQLYGDVALRQFSDLDILVAPEDLQRAIGVFLAQNYECEEDLTERKRSAFLDAMHHYHLSKKLLGITVELHWKSAPSHYGLEMDVPSILSRSKKNTILGKEIFNISNEDQVIFLCLHGIKHTWQKISWICDLARSISSEEIDWMHAIEIARGSNNERVLILGTSMAEELFGIPITQEITRKIDRKDILLKFNKDSINNLVFDGRDQSLLCSVVGEQVVFMSILDGRMEKIIFFFRLVLKPVNEDFAAIRLPDILFPAYYVVRPVRLIMTYKKALWERLWRTKRANH
jgi:hypothetical protein